MNRSTKVAISLPGDILAVIEKERKATGESRSEFFRRAIETLLGQQRESEAVQAYIKGYRNQPETAEEIEALHKAGVEALSGEPW